MNDQAKPANPMLSEEGPRALVKLAAAMLDRMCEAEEFSDDHAAFVVATLGAVANGIQAVRCKVKGDTRSGRECAALALQLSKDADKIRLRIDIADAMADG